MEAELFLLYWQNCDRIGPVIEGKSRLDVETIVSSSSRIAFAFIRARTNVPRNERTVFYQEFRTNESICYYCDNSKTYFNIFKGCFNFNFRTYFNTFFLKRETK